MAFAWQDILTWQDIVTLLAVCAAGGYLCRRAWLLLVRKSSAGCGACPRCAATSPADTTTLTAEKSGSANVIPARAITQQFVPVDVLVNSAGRKSLHSD